MSRAGKSIGTESRLVVAWWWGRMRDQGNVTDDGTGFLLE